MKLWRWVWIPILLVTVAACTTSSQPPEAVPDLMSVVDGVNESAKLTFMEPSFGKSPSGTFDATVPLSIKVFAFAVAGNPAVPTGVLGGALGANFATTDGTIIVDKNQERYQARWLVPGKSEIPQEYVRLEVRFGVGADPNDPLCDAIAAGSCFGYLDVRLVENAAQGKTGTPEGFLPIVRGRDLPIKFHVRTSQDDAPSSIAALRKINNNEPFDEGDGAGENCTEYDVPGQGFQAVGAGLQAVGAGLQAVGAGLQAVGAVGGLFSAQFETSALVSPGTVATEIRKTVVGTDSAEALIEAMVGDLQKPDFEKPIALLVVDDFGDGDPYLLPEPADLFDLVGTAFVPSTGITHGALVMDHVLALLDAAFAVGEPGSMVHRIDSSNGSTVTYEYVPTRGSGPRKRKTGVPLMLVRAVHTNGGDTDAIHAAIQGNLPVEHNRVAYPNVVLNLSFAIVPCVSANDAQASGANLIDLSGDGAVTLDDYIAALALTNDVRVAEQSDLAAAVTKPLMDGDRLLEFLSCSAVCASPGTEAMVKVASSGNFGYAFPFFPAALESVVSVSSQDATGSGYSPQRSTFSNGGEVMTPGSLFIAGMEEVPAGVNVARVNTVAYAGTSFAAPNVSVFTALDLALGEARRCEPGTVLHVADLAHADGDASDADDLPLDVAFGASSALKAYCDP